MSQSLHSQYSLRAPSSEGSGEVVKILDVQQVRYFCQLLSMLIPSAANLPDESLPAMSSVTKTGVYYGYAQVLPPADGKAQLCSAVSRVLPMVMSLGWNPFYKNERMTAVGLCSLPLFEAHWIY